MCRCMLRHHMTRTGMNCVLLHGAFTHARAAVTDASQCRQRHYDASDYYPDSWVDVTSCEHIICTRSPYICYWRICICFFFVIMAYLTNNSLACQNISGETFCLTTLYLKHLLLFCKLGLSTTLADVVIRVDAATTCLPLITDASFSGEISTAIVWCSVVL